MKIWSHRWDLSNSHLIKKTIYNFWTDYEKLSPQQKWLFDDANEKRKIIQELLDHPKHVDYYYKALDDMGDLKSNYYHRQT